MGLYRLCSRSVAGGFRHANMIYELSYRRDVPRRYYDGSRVLARVASAGQFLTVYSGSPWFQASIALGGSLGLQRTPSRLRPRGLARPLCALLLRYS